MILSENQIESFHKNGFLLLDNFFSQSELKRFEDVLDFDGNEFDSAMIKFEQIDHQYIADIYDTIYSTSAFLALAAKKEISECINQIFKRELDNPLYLDQSRCRIDTPFDPYLKKCGWHQEVFYYVPKSDFVHTWSPLIHDAVTETGAIEVCVGSHKEIAKQSDKNPENEKYPFIVNESEIKKYDKQNFKLIIYFIDK